MDVVEPSRVFAERIAALARRDGLGAGRVWGSTLADAALPRGAYDLIFARWVFLFMPDPAERIAQLAAALRPGGVLAIEDYEREDAADAADAAGLGARSWRPIMRSSTRRAGMPASPGCCPATSSAPA